MRLFILEGQVSIRAGIGVSDIAFREGGQSTYLGYEVNSLTHKVPLITYQFGLTGEWTLSSRISIMTDLLWARKGLCYDTDYLYGDFKYKLELHYLEWPVLIECKTNLKKNKNSGLFIGPYLGILLHDQLDRNESGSYEVQYGSVNRLDYGMIVGYQADFGLGDRKLFWDIRSGYSILNMMQYVDDGILSDEHPEQQYVRNVTVMFSVGYVINAKVKTKKP